MKVSVILTVLNEGEAIRPLLDSLVAQTTPPDEVVVADGGSRDNTVAILREYEGRLRLKVIHTPGANISQGRNAAILAASSDLIASTDAGVRCEPDWLEKLTAPFAENIKSQTLNPAPSPQVAAGFFRSDPQTAFELAMGATVLPEARDVNPLTYLPSSRSVAFRWSAWREVGGYPEWLDYSEDVVFDLRLREKYGPFVFVPQAVVNFRPRGSLRAFARQYYRYARGDGKANLFSRLHAIRYFTYFVVAPLLVYAALTVSPGFWGLGVVAGLAYVRLPLRRARSRLVGWSWTDRLRVLLWIPVIRVVGDLAKMAGYAIGTAWRFRVRRSLAWR